MATNTRRILNVALRAALYAQIVMAAPLASAAVAEDHMTRSSSDALDGAFDARIRAAGVDSAPTVNGRPGLHGVVSGSRFLRVVGDPRGEVALSIDDLQRELDEFCAPDGIVKTTQADDDGDGTLETTPWCGRFVVLPGRYRSGADGRSCESGATGDCRATWNIPYSNLAVEGYGAVLENDFPYEEIMSSLAGDDFVKRTVDTVVIGTPGEVVENVTFAGFTIVREDAGRKLDACFANRIAGAPCFNDADQDGTYDSVQRSLIVQTGANIRILNVRMVGALNGHVDVFANYGIGRHRRRGVEIAGNVWEGDTASYCAHFWTGNLNIHENVFRFCSERTGGVYAQRHVGFGGFEWYCNSADGEAYDNITIARNRFESMPRGMRWVPMRGCAGASENWLVEDNQFDSIRSSGVDLADTRTDNTASMAQVVIRRNTIDVGGNYDPFLAWVRNGIVVSDQGDSIRDVSIVDNLVNLRANSDASPFTNNDRGILVGAAGVTPISNSGIRIVGNRIRVLADDYWYIPDGCIGLLSARGVEVSGNACLCENNIPCLGVHCANGSLKPPCTFMTAWRELGEFSIERNSTRWTYIGNGLSPPNPEATVISDRSAMLLLYGDARAGSIADNLLCGLTDSDDRRATYPLLVVGQGGVTDVVDDGNRALPVCPKRRRPVGQ